MNTSKSYFQVGIIGHCIILAQELGKDQEGSLFSFFAAFMITRQGKPACSLAESFALARITNGRNKYSDLIGFCQGFSEASQTFRGCSGRDWKYQETINASDVYEPTQDELRVLRAYPETPGTVADVMARKAMEEKIGGILSKNPYPPFSVKVNGKQVTSSSCFDSDERRDSNGKSL